MELPIYQVDAFASALFKGNPAAIVPLDNWLPDELLQQIAAENNLSETAYFVPEGDGFRIRWMTPTVEVALCGHATLATAWVMWNCLGHADPVIRFYSQSGPLQVTRHGDWLELDFPAQEPRPLTDVPAGLAEALGVDVLAVYKGSSDLLVELASEDMVKRVTPDFRKLAAIPARGVIITAPGNEVDFVSRFFAPGSGIDEDPVTGSAHTLLVPFWATKLGKNDFLAHQVSARGGVLKCSLTGDRVKMAGQGVLYLTGRIIIDL